MKRMFFWNLILFSSFTQVSHLSATEITLPISGLHTGEDPELFTLLTTSPSGTNYTLRSEFIVRDFLGFNVRKSGGAFCNLEGPLTFSGTTPLASLTFTNIELGGLGCGIFSKSPLNFKNLKALNVESNQSIGGVITSQQDMLFSKNVSLLFRNNVCLGAGGAILTTGTQRSLLEFNEQRGPIAFINNSAQVVKNVSHSGNGGAICADVPGSSVLFNGNQEILFQSNQAKFGGGIFSNGDVVFIENKGSVSFLENNALESGGAIYSTDCEIKQQSTPVVFSKNQAKIFGGAICSKQIVIKQNEAPIVFSQNSAAGGGAITTAHCNIVASQPIIFSENSSGSLGGGAIYLKGPQPTLQLHAHSADIIFQDNRTTTQQSKHSTITTHNAITIHEPSSTIHLLANENQSIIFYDPVLATAPSTKPVFINTVENIFHCGSVVFSGEKLSIDYQDNSNKTSIFNQPLYLNNGTLSITGGAILAVQEFHQKGGALHISPGSMLTNYNSSGKDMEITNISFGLDTTKNHLPAEIRATGGSVIKLSGTPHIHDPDLTFYDNHDLASQPYQMEIIFKSEKGINTENFVPEEISVQQNNYGYQGIWKFSWSGEDTKKQKTLKALWFPKQGAFILNPDKQGILVPSSTWVTFAGMRASNDAILDNYLNNNLLVPIDHLCIFGGALSNVTEQRSNNELNFSSRQTGHNLGIKLPLSPNTVFCAAFSQLYGSSSQKHQPGSSRSHMLMGTVTACKNWRALSFRSSASYVEESHVMTHQFSKKDVTRGTWKNQGFRGCVGLAYAYPRGIRCLKITPFIDFEYSLVNQNPFIETGYDPRYFSSSSLSNLAIPTGVALEMRFFGIKYSLFSQFSMAYIKDIHRENPQTSASLILNQHNWKVDGIFMGQEAMKLKFRTTLKYGLATAYLGISTMQSEGNNLSGDAFGGLSLNF